MSAIFSYNENVIVFIVEKMLSLQKNILRLKKEKLTY